MQICGLILLDMYFIKYFVFFCRVLGWNNGNLDTEWVNTPQTQRLHITAPNKRVYQYFSYFFSKTNVRGTRITKTRLYNFDPLKPHFYVVKLGFTGVHIVFLILLKTIDCAYSWEPPHWGSSDEYPQSMFWEKIWKISVFFVWVFSFFWL